MDAMTAGLRWGMMAQAVFLPPRRKPRPMTPPAPPFAHLTVIGCGLIGGSFLMACRQAYPTMTIHAVDRDAQTLQFLLRHDLARHVSPTLPTHLEPGHLVLLATHLRDSLSLLEALAPHVSDHDVLVSDVGSCKRAICTRGAELLGARFIGGHPLAGKEFSGVGHATPLLFHGKPYALCPAAGESHPLADALRQVLSVGLGAHVRELPADEHDRAMAFVSHFPQLYAVLLANLLGRHQPGHLLALHGAGLDDQLRLAASPYALWRDVFAFNEDNLREILGLFGGLCAEAEPLLTQPAMAMWFERANEAHHAFHQSRLPGSIASVSTGD